MNNEFLVINSAAVTGWRFQIPPHRQAVSLCAINMTSSADFDCFLKHGYINGLIEGASMQVLIDKYGEEYWSAKEIETNGLINGIIEVGSIEFHIYNEKISGISYRPDKYRSTECKGRRSLGTTIPWIFEFKSLPDVERNLFVQGIEYKKFVLTGPITQPFVTAGGEWFSLDQGEHFFIDTEGGVTILFEEGMDGTPVAYQACKYYKKVALGT